MTAFDDQKATYLRELSSTAKDRSKKGDVDEEAKPILDAINAHPDLYTTSSCAGRIDVFVEPESGKKHEGEWRFVTHDRAKTEDVLQALEEVPAETVWFRMEGAIVHVCCRSLDAAEAFLLACREAGWKHSGILTTGKRIIIEATTPERVDVPVAKDGESFVPEKFIGFLVKEANEKLVKTREKMERLERRVRAMRR